MRRSKIRIAVLFIVGAWFSQAKAVDQATVAHIESEIAAYAHAHGETVEQFVDRIGSPLWHIESFVYGVEQAGGTAAAALGNLERFVAALNDPEKRKLMKCAGIRIPQDTDPSPSPIECAVLTKKYGGQ